MPLIVIKYKTAVYTLVNGNVKKTNTSKTAKIIKGDISAE